MSLAQDRGIEANVFYQKTGQLNKKILDIVYILQS